MIILKAPYRKCNVGGRTYIRTFFKEETAVKLSSSIDKYIYMSVHSKFYNGMPKAYSKI